MASLLIDYCSIGEKNKLVVIEKITCVNITLGY